jgi:hypothetical protein
MRIQDINSDIGRLAKRDKLLAIQSTNYQRLQNDLHNLLVWRLPRGINNAIRLAKVLRAASR